ncbi:MAG TPA: Gfo/Idh/MocA family oxidoreductase [Nocardioides sp.]|jgi:predicted dehydrogenase|uniref:Gfo/Idh/MocA family protein n=1 Tax=Nocardioides sp. TaxID=35761 RepID=UPI002E31A499|nr:Gfo/Idh/MocA family oxidoreductase [Nocardioides sp.]HEX3932754.1 Gfo/Idh/MocA family oxidoreductase [Nocardioides sp.]
MTTSTPEPTRWGILATGKIARTFAENLRATPGAVLAAVGSRSQESADAFARDLGDDDTRAHASYDALVADPDVDVVYVASPHTHHLEHARLAFAAGKPVLCEKPLTMTRADAEALFDAAGSLFCMEAMWMACHPLVRELRARIEGGELGTPHQVHADLGFVVGTDASARMWDPALGAGALLDMGIYPLTFARLMLGPFATAVAVGDLGADGIDLDVAIAARHRSGAVSALTTSMTSASPRSATVATSRGLLSLPADFHHPAHAVWTPDGGEPQRIEPPTPVYGTGLGNEALHVQECLQEGLAESPLVPRSQTLELLGVMDDLRRQLGVRYAADAGAPA